MSTAMPSNEKPNIKKDGGGDFDARRLGQLLNIRRESSQGLSSSLSQKRLSTAPANMSSPASVISTASNTSLTDQANKIRSAYTTTASYTNTRSQTYQSSRSTSDDDADNLQEEHDDNDDDVDDVPNQPQGNDAASTTIKIKSVDSNQESLTLLTQKIAVEQSNLQNLYAKSIQNNRDTTAGKNINLSLTQEMRKIQQILSPLPDSNHHILAATTDSTTPILPPLTLNLPTSDSDSLIALAQLAQRHFTKPSIQLTSLPPSSSSSSLSKPSPLINVSNSSVSITGTAKPQILSFPSSNTQKIVPPIKSSGWWPFVRYFSTSETLSETTTTASDSLSLKSSSSEGGAVVSTSQSPPPSLPRTSTSISNKNTGTETKTTSSSFSSTTPSHSNSKITSNPTLEYWTYLGRLSGSLMEEDDNATTSTLPKSSSFPSIHNPKLLPASKNIHNKMATTTRINPKATATTDTATNENMPSSSTLKAASKEHINKQPRSNCKRWFLFILIFGTCAVLFQLEMSVDDAIITFTTTPPWNHNNNQEKMHIKQYIMQLREPMVPIYKKYRQNLFYACQSYPWCMILSQQLQQWISLGKNTTANFLALDGVEDNLSVYPNHPNLLLWNDRLWFTLQKTKSLFTTTTHDISIQMETHEKSNQEKNLDTILTATVTAKSATLIDTPISTVPLESRDRVDKVIDGEDDTFKNRSTKSHSPISKGGALSWTSRFWSRCILHLLHGIVTILPRTIHEEARSKSKLEKDIVEAIDIEKEPNNKYSSTLQPMHTDLKSSMNEKDVLNQATETISSVLDINNDMKHEEEEEESFDKTNDDTPQQVPNNSVMKHEEEESFDATKQEQSNNVMKHEEEESIDKTKGETSQQEQSNQSTNDTLHKKWTPSPMKHHEFLSNINTFLHCRAIARYIFTMETGLHYFDSVKECLQHHDYECDHHTHHNHLSSISSSSSSFTTIQFWSKIRRICLNPNDHHYSSYDAFMNGKTCQSNALIPLSFDQHASIVNFWKSRNKPFLKIPEIGPLLPPDLQLSSQQQHHQYSTKTISTVELSPMSSEVGITTVASGGVVKANENKAVQTYLNEKADDDTMLFETPLMETVSDFFRNVRDEKKNRKQQKTTVAEVATTTTSKQNKKKKNRNNVTLPNKDQPRNTKSRVKRKEKEKRKNEKKKNEQNDKEKHGFRFPWQKK